MKRSRSLFVLSEANGGKIGALDALHAEYLRYLKSCTDRLLEAHRCAIPNKDLAAFFLPEYVLSTNIVTCAHHHAVGIILAWYNSRYSLRLKHEIKRLSRLGLIDEELKRALFTVGKCGVQKPSAKIPQEAIDFYWSLLIDEKVGGRPPTISGRVGMRMSCHTSDLRLVPGTKLASWWLGFSGLLRGRRVQLPLSANPFVSARDQVKAGLLVRKDRKGRWKVEVLEAKDVSEPESFPDAPRLGVDVGLNVLAATSSGALYGKEVKPKFDKLYSKIKELRANRQRQNLPRSSTRLDCLEDRLSGLVKTATGTIANQLVKSHPGHVFVVEDLDLQGCKGQKRFAYRALHASLARKATCIVVNPAYTSQMCPSCGYVARGNRSSTKFSCRVCGRKSHADVVGAVNLLRRSEDNQIGLNSTTYEVKTLLRNRYLANRNGSCTAGTGPEDGSMRCKLATSSAIPSRAPPGRTGIAINAEVCHESDLQAEPGYRP